MDREGRAVTEARKSSGGAWKSTERGTLRHRRGALATRGARANDFLTVEG